MEPGDAGRSCRGRLDRAHEDLLEAFVGKAGAAAGAERHQGSPAQGQRLAGGGGLVRGLRPAVARPWRPGRAPEAEPGHAGAPCRRRRLGTHPRRIGVSGVDQGPHTPLSEVAPETLGTAETTRSHLEA